MEQVLDQLDHFAADDAYIGKLAEEHFDSEDMWQVLKNKIFELMDSIRTVAVTDTIR